VIPAEGAAAPAGSGRPLDLLPKAHLHLHFTGSLRPVTLLELAAEGNVRLPDVLTSTLADMVATGHGPRFAATDERGWFRFQRLYDAARATVRSESAVRRLILQAAEDDRAEGSRWLELQVDPTTYAPWLGGLTSAIEIMLDAARGATAQTGVGVRLILAASRLRHPLDARTLARLAARFAGDGVVGFGLSNDERRGRTADFAPAFRIARSAGLLSVPHGGELVGAGHVRVCLDLLAADRIGHGVRAVDDPDLLTRLAAAGVTLEVCPTSNVALGVAAEPADVPLRAIIDAGVPVALGADDPLLFGSRLVAQYEHARSVTRLDDTQLAELARQSVRASTASPDERAPILAGIDEWLAAPPPSGPDPGRA
jgi:adenosine deaminase